MKRKIKNIKSLIAKSKTAKAIDLLLEIKSDYDNEIILISNRWKELKLQRINDIITQGDFEKERNKINKSVLNIVDLILSEFKESNLEKAKLYILSHKLIITLILGLLLSCLLFFKKSLFEKENIQIEENKEIIIGGKNFMESSILLEIMAVLIEKYHPEFTVKRDFNHGETIHNFESIQNGKIHIYAEYTGTILAQFMNLPFHEIRNEKYHKTKEINKLLKKNDKTKDLVWVNNFGFNNTYVIVVLKETSDSFKLANRNGEILLSDLHKVAPKLSFKSEFGFYHRPDGFTGLTKNYKLKFKRYDVILHDNKYLGLVNKEMDITDGYSTDPQLYSDSIFVQIDDDDNFFPKYYAGPLVNKSILKRVPNITETFKKIESRITEKEMSNLLDRAFKENLQTENLNTSIASRRKLNKIVVDYLKNKMIIE